MSQTVHRNVVEGDKETPEDKKHGPHEDEIAFVLEHDLKVVVADIALSRRQARDDEHTGWNQQSQAEEADNSRSPSVPHMVKQLRQYERPSHASEGAPGDDNA